MQISNSEPISPAPRKILVLGATGGTGQLIVSQALDRGEDITVLIRSPEKAKDFHGTKVVIGDARHENVLTRALEGRDAVISALGTPASPLREVRLLSRRPRRWCGQCRLPRFPGWWLSPGSAPATVPVTAASCSTG